MFHPHGRQQLQREREAELALIDPVDEDLHVHGRALGGEPAREVLVGHLPVFPQFLDEPLGAMGVKVSPTAAGRYIVFHLRAWYLPILDSRPINGIPFMAKTYPGDAPKQDIRPSPRLSRSSP